MSVQSAAMQRMLEATARAENEHFWFKGLRRTARRMIESARAGRSLARILDCGAGTGRNLDWLGEFGEAVGVELTPFGIEAGRRQGRRLIRASVAGLPLADATVDLATSFDVLYCLDDSTETRALREMYRVVKPGGLVLVNVAALDILRGSHSTLTHEVRRYTPAGLREKLRAAGFHVLRLTYTNLPVFPVALALRGLERLTGRAGSASEHDLAVPSPPINAAFNAALAAESALLGWVNMPIGTSIMAVAERPGRPASPARAGARHLR